MNLDLNVTLRQSHNFVSQSLQRLLKALDSLLQYSWDIKELVYPVLIYPVEALSVW